MATKPPTARRRPCGGTRFDAEAARPFGSQSPQWDGLKAQMRAGDVLRLFASPAESWQHLAGRAGIALVRTGSVIGSIVTMMN